MRSGIGVRTTVLEGAGARKAKIILVNGMESSRTTVTINPSGLVGVTCPVACLPGGYVLISPIVM